MLFFFYGKPSFRTSKGETSTSNLAFMPVALAVQPGSLTSIKRIAPFDTGAFFRNLFSSHMHPRMQCTDFLLNPSLDMPGRLVARFFGSNENYYFGRPQYLLIPPLAFEVQAYYDLIRGSGQTPYDDRRSAVELQSSESLILDQSSVMLVILPGEFLDDQEIRNIIAMEWAAEVKTYSVHHSSPREYMSQLYRGVEEFLREHNYL